MINHVHKNKGFTLIELVVSIGIFMSLLLLTVVNFRSGESLAELRLTSQQLASTIRKLQTIALAGSTYGDQEMGAGGFGIKLSASITGYQIYSDEGLPYGQLNDDDLLLDDQQLTNIESMILQTTAGDLLSEAHLVFLPRSSSITLQDESGVLYNEKILQIEIFHNRVADKKGVIEVTPISGQVNFYIDENN